MSEDLVPFDSRHMPVHHRATNAYAVKAKMTPVDWAVSVARKLGHRPEDIVFVNEVSIDGLVFRPVLNSEVLNILFEDLIPGDIYTVGRLHLRKNITILGVNDHNLVAPPMLVR